MRPSCLILRHFIKQTTYTKNVSMLLMQHHEMRIAEEKAKQETEEKGSAEKRFVYSSVNKL
jgi:hypothetical protein